MSTLRRVSARTPVAIASIAVLSLLPLLVWDVAPARFPSRSHDLLGATPLLAIAASYFALQVVHKPSRLGWLRATLVVGAFVAWAANQCWPRHALAMLWNDVAIALFVIDIFLSVAKAPGTGVAPPLTDEPGDAEASPGPPAAPLDRAF